MKNTNPNKHKSPQHAILNTNVMALNIIAMSQPYGRQYEPNKAGNT